MNVMFLYFDTVVVEIMTVEGYTAVFVLLPLLFPCRRVKAWPWIS